MGLTTVSDNYLTDRGDPKELEKLWNERFADADTPEEFVRRFNAPSKLTPKQEREAAEHGLRRINSQTGLMQDEDDQLQSAVDAYENLDANLAPGGLFAGLPKSKRLELETEVYRMYGPRPEYLTPEEIVANEQAEALAESVRMRADLEADTAQRLYDLGFANIDEAREWYAIPVSKRPPAPVPSLIETEQGVPAYVLPGGEIVEEYATAFGKAAKNPKFAEIAARVEQIQKARR